MSYGTLIMQAVTAELQEILPGAIVQKVTEPARGEVVLNLYQNGRQLNLLLSIDSRYARVHITALPRKDKGPNIPPSPFCMLLRKYLIGSRIASFSNPPLERVMELAFAAPDGLPPVKIIAEIMSRRSNIILIGEDQAILGALRLVSWDKNPVRAIFPGEKYRPVPTQSKLNPLLMSEEEFLVYYQENREKTVKPENALIATVDGISPLIARELLYRSSQGALNDSEKYTILYREVQKLFADAERKNLKPVLLPDRNIYAATSLLHLSKEKQVEYDSVNQLLDLYYSGLIRSETEKALRELLQNAVLRRLNALRRKELALKNDLKTAGLASQHRLYGELLLAYGDQVLKGAESALLPDLYNPDQKILVPLNPSRTAAANAQHYFNRYRKAKKGREEIRRQLKITGLEAEYCRALLYSIENNEGSSLAEIRQELVDANYLRDRQKGKKRELTAPQPLVYKTSSGKSILVGRNNRQNDHVTFKAAVRKDIWLHIRQLPGSHVVLKETGWPPLKEDLEEAAFLAAYYSKGRDNNAADIDYTEVRHVRRRPGGKPGLVFYENYETITVNPLNPELRKRFNLN